MVWYSHAWLPSAALRATTEPWPEQHSERGFMAEATPEADSGTMILSFAKMTPPRIWPPEPSTGWPLAFQTRAPLAASTTWMSRPTESATTRWPPISPIAGVLRDEAA